MRSIALLLAFACSCTVAQARKAHTAGEIALPAGLFAILGCVAVAEAVPSISSQALETGVVFVPISVIGALVYAATDSTVQEADDADAHRVSARDQAYSAAYELAREAKHAARRGDCAEVQALEPRVRDLDQLVYRKFLHDQIIRPCLMRSEP